MTSLLQRLLNTLEAGEVTRYHAVPSVPPQNIAHHSWNVECILMYLCPQFFVLHPKSSGFLLDEARLHDTAELFTGDIPFTVKQAHPSVKAKFDELEYGYREHELIGEAFILFPEEKQLLKLADTLDGFIWCAKYERPTGRVEGRWHEAYLVARSKFFESITDRYGPDTWNRADALFNQFGGIIK